MPKRRRRRINLGEVTKSDFIAIAKILSSECASHSVTKRLANYFGGVNPRFDKSRFLKAASCSR